MSGPRAFAPPSWRTPESPLRVRISARAFSLAMGNGVFIRSVSNAAAWAQETKLKSSATGIAAGEARIATFHAHKACRTAARTKARRRALGCYGYRATLLWHQCLVVRRNEANVDHMLLYDVSNSRHQ